MNPTEWVSEETAWSKDWVNCCWNKKEDRYFRSPRATHPLPKSDFPWTDKSSPLGENALLVVLVTPYIETSK